MPGAAYTTPCFARLRARGAAALAFVLAGAARRAPRAWPSAVPAPARAPRAWAMPSSPCPTTGRRRPGTRPAWPSSASPSSPSSMRSATRAWPFRPALHPTANRSTRIVIPRPRPELLRRLLRARRFRSRSSASPVTLQVSWRRALPAQQRLRRPVRSLSRRRSGQRRGVHPVRGSAGRKHRRPLRGGRGEADEPDVRGWRRGLLDWGLGGARLLCRAADPARPLPVLRLARADAPQRPTTSTLGPLLNYPAWSAGVSLSRAVLVGLLQHIEAAVFGRAAGTASIARAPASAFRAPIAAGLAWRPRRSGRWPRP